MIISAALATMGHVTVTQRRVERVRGFFTCADQIGRQGRQSVILILRPTILDGYILTLNVTGVL
jgi:hypothetical protein